MKLSAFILGVVAAQYGGYETTAYPAPVYPEGQDWIKINQKRNISHFFLFLI